MNTQLQKQTYNHAKEVAELKKKTCFFSQQQFGSVQASSESIIIRWQMKCPSGTNKTAVLMIGDIKVYQLILDLVPIRGGSVNIFMEKRNPTNPTYWVFFNVCRDHKVKNIEMFYRVTVHQNDCVILTWEAKNVFEKDIGRGTEIIDDKFNPELELSVVVHMSEYKVHI